MTQAMGTLLAQPALLDGMHERRFDPVGAVDTVVRREAELPHDTAVRLGDLEHAALHRGATDAARDEDVAVGEAIGVTPERRVPVAGVRGLRAREAAGKLPLE